MSYSKWILCVLTGAAVAGTAFAESQRTLFTQDNMFPRWEQLEAGVSYGYVEQTDDEGFLDVDTTSVTPYVRYGLLENLALRLDVPFLDVEPSRGSGESGVGDVEVQLQLRAYEDIFEYPFIIPHVTVTLPTGDEDKGLGSGDSVVIPGITLGTVVNDTLTWIADGSYRINPDQKNQMLLGLSLIYTVSDKLDFLVEGSFESNAGVNQGETRILVTGGMIYDWTPALQMGLYGGSAVKGDMDFISEARLSYSF